MRQRRPQLRRRAGSPGKITRYLVKITRYLGFDGVTLSPHGRHEKASFRPLSRPSLHSLTCRLAPCAGRRQVPSHCHDLAAGVVAVAANGYYRRS